MFTTVEVDEDGTIVGYSTIAETAKRWNVPEVTVRVWIQRGKVPALRIGRNTYIMDSVEKPAPGKPGRPTGKYY